MDQETFLNGCSLFTRRAFPPRAGGLLRMGSGVVLVAGRGRQGKQNTMRQPAAGPPNSQIQLIKTPLQLKWPANLPTGYWLWAAQRPEAPMPRQRAVRDRAGRYFCFVLGGPSPAHWLARPPGAWTRLNSKLGSQKPEPGRCTPQTSRRTRGGRTANFGPCFILFYAACERGYEATRPFGPFYTTAPWQGA